MSDASMAPKLGAPNLGLPEHIDEATFRNVMAAVCAPVTIVTTSSGGKHFGSTVSAFCSLSLKPPMISIALDRSSEVLHAIRDERRVAINLLSHEQHELALHFARKGDKFKGASYRIEHELPRLDGVMGYMACSVSAIVDAGDHELVLAIVHAADVDDASGPLVYQRRVFGTHSGFGKK
jgi:flavin reductase (DIM6/NTAB) family NADH-FMN oxidoreductase RutF